jgi:hypothetical protein
MVAHTCNPRTWKAEFKANLGYIARPSKKRLGSLNEQRSIELKRTSKAISCIL